MSLGQLRKKIESKEAILGVIGLGYVGLPVALVFARAGFQVIGVDIDEPRIDKINAGVSPIEGREPGLAELLERVVAQGRMSATSDYAELSQADVAMICVETPIDEDHIPRYEALRGALTSLGTVMKKGALVIVESTIAPGTMNKIVRPLLEQVSSRKVNEGFYLGHCPERVMPGKLLHNIETISRVVGGSMPETAEVMIKLYRNVVKAELDPTDLVTAELVKTAENAYRDVNIAFANELALICEAVGGDVWEVRELVNKSPGRNVLLPGAGVGGHCIPKDPWLLAHGVKDSKINLQLIPAARNLNDWMPAHIAQTTLNALNRSNRDVASAKVLVLGYAYLEDSDDDRNSPSEALVELLRDKVAEISIHDPYIPEFQGEILDLWEGKDAIILMVAHHKYQDLIEQVDSFPILIDARGLWRDKPMEETGFSNFHTIGRGWVK